MSVLELPINDDPRPLLLRIKLHEIMKASDEQRERLFLEYQDQVFVIFSTKENGFNNIRRAYQQGFFSEESIQTASVIGLQKAYEELTQIAEPPPFLAEEIELCLLPRL